MSAFLCTPEHIQQLVLFTHERRAADGVRWLGIPDTIDRDARIARILASANLASLAARYPDDHDDPADDEAFILSCIPAVFHVCQLAPVAVLKALACFEYQACEVPDWSDTEACRVVRALEGAAISMLPGYDAAAWAISAENLKPNTMISLSGLVAHQQRGRAS